SLVPCSSSRKCSAVEECTLGTMTEPREVPQGIEKDALGGVTGHPKHMPIVLSANPAIGPQGFPDMLRSRTASRERLFSKEVPNSAQHRGIHGRGNAPRLGILLAGVVDAKQSRTARRHLGFRAVPKLVGRAGRNQSA